MKTGEGERCDENRGGGEKVIRVKAFPEVTGFSEGMFSNESVIA